MGDPTNEKQAAEAIETLREAASGWPQPNRYDEALDALAVRLSRQQNTIDAHQDVIEAARLIEAYDQAGGNDWWEAHAKLYAALAALRDGRDA